MLPGTWRPYFYFLNTWWLHCNAWLQDWQEVHESFSAANSRCALTPTFLITLPLLACISMLTSHCAGLAHLSSCIQHLSAPTLKAWVGLSFLQPWAAFLPLPVQAPEAGPWLCKASLWQSPQPSMVAKANGQHFYTCILIWLHAYLFSVVITVLQSVIFLSCFPICLLAKNSFSIALLQWPS